MAFASNISHAQNGFTLAGILARFRSHMERRRVFRSTYNELVQLSDRELSDLGLNRSMIRRLALQASLEAK